MDPACKHWPETRARTKMTLHTEKKTLAEDEPLHTEKKTLAEDEPDELISNSMVE